LFKIGDLWGKYPLFHPMHSAARVGAIEVMKMILKTEPTVINELDEKKLTPLHHAALYTFIDKEHKMQNQLISY
jgi:hypothetical protein